MAWYKLPEDLRASLITYLRAQPYGQVVEGMRELENLQKVEDAPKIDLKAVESE